MLRSLLAPHVSYFTHTLDSPPDLDSPVSLGLSEAVVPEPRDLQHYTSCMSPFLIFLNQILL